MTNSKLLSTSLVRIDTNDDFSEAVLLLSDESRLCFCHRVEERWAKSVGSDFDPTEGATADLLVNTMSYFRLNAKHLDVTFDDGSRWEHFF